jgi:hypothetical protein
MIPKESYREITRTTTYRMDNTRKPKSSKQQYKITQRGVAFLQLLHKKKE